MKNQGFSLFWFLCVCLWMCPFSLSANNDKQLRMLIIAADSHLPLSTARVRWGERTYWANEKGEIRFTDEQRNTDSLRVQALGYLDQSIAASEIRAHQPYRVLLAQHTNQLGEAVVEGKNTKHWQNKLASSINSADIQSHLGSSFATVLQDIKGISMVQTGATIAKPVLHGMYGSRLLIMNNGVRQTGQQWGNDHAPELDANVAGSITVVKGAESVRYGAEALGGVVMLESKALPYQREQWNGRVSSLYASNGQRWALTATAERGLSLWNGQGAFRLQGTYLNGGDRSTARYLLNNSGNREANFSSNLGFQQERWGVEAFYSLFNTELGILYSAQMGNEQLLNERIALGEPQAFNPWTRTIDVPRQQVRHQVAKLKGYYNFSAQQKLNLQIAYQHDARQEFQLRRNYRSHIPELDLNLQNWQFDGHYKSVFADHWTSEVGTFFAYVNNHNVPGTGVVPIIPNYTQSNVGLFAVQKYSGEKWGAELGLRADKQNINALGMNVYGESYGGKSSYHNFTYSLGAHKHLSQHVDLLTNFGTAWRAANVHELYSEGLEQSSGLFSLGDANLQPEVSSKWVTSLKYAQKAWKIGVDVYLQWINNYIYHEPTRQKMTIISGTYPVFRYRAADAFFRGIDGDLHLDIAPRLSYELTASMIWANERTTGRYLPFIPTFRTVQQLQWKIGDWGHLHNLRCELTHRFVDKQHRFDPATDLIDFAPSAYHLLGFEVGASWHLGNGQKINFLLSGDNLFNHQYKEYTNRFRYYAHDLGRDLRLMLSYEF